MIVLITMLTVSGLLLFTVPDNPKGKLKSYESILLFCFATSFVLVALGGLVRWIFT